MKQPEQRYQSAAELILDLQKVFLSPDGNYVYVDPLVDDSPTIQRNTEDIEKIRKSLTGTERKRDVEEKKSQVEEEGEEEEDYKANSCNYDSLRCFSCLYRLLSCWEFSSFIPDIF